jgi:hypothetical protein
VSDLYDREGNPISIEQWRLLFEDKRYQILKQTQIGTLQVSTIWLGVDHNWDTYMHNLDQRPLIFETMIFGSEEEKQWRYASEQEALAHHDELCEQIRLLESVG